MKGGLFPDLFLERKNFLSAPPSLQTPAAFSATPQVKQVKVRSEE